MKTFLDELEERGLAKGLARGRAEGREIGLEEGRDEEIVAGIARILRKRFDVATAERLSAKIETINYYPSLEEIFDAALDATDETELTRFVDSVASRK